MFESLNATLLQCGIFFIVGILLSVFYEIPRVIRLMIHHNTLAVAIEDVLFFAFSAFVMFVSALSVGEGYFRVYYVVFAVMGAALYFLTLGRLLNFLLKKLFRALRRMLRYFSRIIGKYISKSFGVIIQKIKPGFVLSNKFLQSAKKSVRNILPKSRKVMYNESTDIKSESGEKRSAIKAEIRKKA